MVTFENIRNDAEIRAYIEAADRTLSELGYTEHSFAHVSKVADDAAGILLAVGRAEREIELAKIAGYMHDIGNLVNRSEHSQSGAVMAFTILKERGMAPDEIAEIVTAIGNHDEGTGVPVSELAAALILADKSDVRRTRVRNIKGKRFDIHDRVNYSTERSDLIIDRESATASLELTIDTSISSIMDYFEIFLTRMTLCRHAAERLGLAFKLSINGQSFI